MGDKRIRIKNTSRGPLHIMRLWDPSHEQKVVATDYKHNESGVIRNQRIVKKQVHGSFLLRPGEVSEELPDAAARSEQIAGLHRAKLVAVFPA